MNKIRNGSSKKPNSEHLWNQSVFCKYYANCILVFNRQQLFLHSGGKFPSCYCRLFHQGYPYATIVELLKKQGIVMHLRTLKQKLGSMGLSTRGTNVDEDMVGNIVAEEMIGAGRLAGYRYMARTPLATPSACTQKSSCSFGKRIGSRRCWRSRDAHDVWPGVDILHLGQTSVGILMVSLSN